ncbi:Gfo/Idh/MocA family protein [Crossiella sp. CA198]|uniref:Gfo/Idh/MocA family protein n=1 Tax=Crossiella sp. CA198 TaxID=3455607 RepID=UPI003F8D3047
MPPAATGNIRTIAKEVIKIGVLGCADIASRRILPTVARNPELRLTAVASRDPGKAAALSTRFGADPVTGYEQLLTRPDVDAVYLPLPAALHTEWITRALLAGKHVLAEKPLSTSAQDSRALLALAQRQGLVLMENYMFPWHGQHQRVRELVRDGAIGEPRAFEATFAIPARPAGDIRHQPALGGGALLDTAGYPVQAAQLLLGGELRVLGATRWSDPELGVDLGGTALLADPAGVSAQLTFGLGHAYTSRYSFLGSAGRLSLEHVFTPPATHRPVLHLHRQDHREELTLAADDQYANAIAAFAGAVLGRADANTATTLRQAELIDEIRLCQAGNPPGGQL